MKANQGLQTIRPPVLVLHGLIRTRLSMRPLALGLRRAGYTVRNVGYPTRTTEINELARLLLSPLVADLRSQGCQRFHVVTHSMSGIVLRAYLQHVPVPELGRVVMLCPPNHGSELADAFGPRQWFRSLLGPAACQLTTGPEGLPEQLGPFSGELGILAGTHTRPFLSNYFSGPNDGIVSVASTQLEGMTDFLTLPYGHSFFMYHQAVIAQVLFFLENGRFQRADSSV